MADELRVSFSAVQDWRACPQRYWYRYVDGLRPKVEAPAPTLGRILHRYLEGFHSLLKAKRKAKFAATKAWQATDAEFAEECKQLAWVASGIGEEELAAELAGLVPLGLTLAQAYHRVRGVADAERYEILLIEDHFEIPVADGIVLPGVIDLVTRDRETGRIQIWEHKSTRSVPRQGRRFRDLQTLLYVVALEMSQNIKAEEIVWNYLRTYPPTPPNVLKNGTLSQAKNQVTTVDLYAAEVMKLGLDVGDYKEFIDSVAEREQTEMFPRYELPIVAAEDVLLRDYVHSAQEIAGARKAHEVSNLDGWGPPTRNVGASCDWCSYVKLCEGVLLGGDDEALKERLFKVKGQREENTNGSKNTSEEDFAAVLD